MNRLKQTLKKCVAFGVTGIMLILAGCKSPAGFASNDNEEYNARMEEARTTPFLPGDYRIYTWKDDKC